MTSCPEYQQMCLSRRSLLHHATVAAGVSVFGSTVVTASPAGAAARRVTSSAPAVVVVLSLRGAADGLSLVVPHSDPNYATARPRLAIPTSSLLAADSTFGLHPQLADLLPWWNDGTLAAVHGTGLAVANRSHFAAMEELEDADPTSPERVGWVNRILGSDTDLSPLQGISVGSGTVPTAMYGPAAVMSTGDDVTSVRVYGDDQWDPNGGRMKSLNLMWGSGGGTIGVGARSALASVADFAPVKQTPATPENAAVYPDGDLGRALAATARIIKGDVGTQVITVDHSSWDLHAGAGNLEWGDQKSLTRELAGGLSALMTDLGTLAGKVTVVALTEFGRRVAENENWGTDHGWGGVMFVLGAGVNGGKYFARNWQSLGTGLDADVPVTTDYRHVLAEVVGKRLGVSTATVFPGFSMEPLGVMV